MTDNFYLNYIPDAWLKFLLPLFFTLSVVLAILSEQADSTRIEQTYSIVLIINGVIVFSWLFRRSLYIHTKYYKSIRLCYASVIVYALFKIMHWPYQEMLLALAAAFAFIPYLIFSYQRRKVSYTLVLRLAIIGLITAVLLKFLHYPYVDEINIISGLIINLYALIYRDRPSLIKNQE